MKKYVFVLSILVSSMLPALVEAKASELQGNVIFDSSIKEKTPEASALKKVIENSFRVSTNINATDEDYALYRTKDYVQYVDGKKLNYDEYVSHRKAVNSSVKSIKVVFYDMIFEGNKVVTSHKAYATKNDDKEIELQVIAIFEIKDGKIISCNELTHMLKGERSDRDIGSR